MTDTPKAEKLTAEEEAELRCILIRRARNGDDNYATYNGAKMARVVATLDASRADLAALQQVIDQQAELLRASRAATEAVRRERDEAHAAYVEESVDLTHVAAERAAIRALAAELVDGWQRAAAVAERAKIVSAPEDAEVEALCNRTGYGAVMDAAARLWVKRDPIGAFVCGPCLGTVKSVLARARALGIGGEREKGDG